MVILVLALVGVLPARPYSINEDAIPAVELDWFF